MRGTFDTEIRQVLDQKKIKGGPKKKSPNFSKDLRGGDVQFDSAGDDVEKKAPGEYIKKGLPKGFKPTLKGVKNGTRI